ncbi:MAG: hypothetical protein N0C84_01350 [Candidatus Thiodiazotropha taylori]|uniref:Uncharacterized protein n=1 Tax=Candidatus Thiodiazotropha taylori TaxID=2792791 RepID=A0A9E4K9R4_9GAMM|nr:hypothetical protein [Candidatus Thiodiazotropha taylori]MCW4255093.1 hypothetical protein [Candidatus Thiodiazotropha taylori]
MALAPEDRNYLEFLIGEMSELSQRYLMSDEEEIFHLLLETRDEFEFFMHKYSFEVQADEKYAEYKIKLFIPYNLIELVEHRKASQ